MIGRLVITSVPQGLGGGNGFQPVLRTRGLAPQVESRLAQLASYSHPFDFGDPRNPRVIFHRIERAGGRTIHVLGSIRDAGSSYSGRSNHLAEMVALAPEEVAAMPAGPVFAAFGFPWFARWEGSPREVPPESEPEVPRHDPAETVASGRPNRCEAWAAATGDAGWAGELAKSFTDGRRALIWVDDQVDVARLFAEAARLLPPSMRWRLEFNTCEIEPFPVHWRAVRPDLPIVGPRAAPTDLVLDLAAIRKNKSRCADHALARQARGDQPSDEPSRGASSFGVGAAAAATFAPADDASLRARLQEIRNDRLRRSFADSRSAGGAADAPGADWRTVAMVGGAGVAALALFSASVLVALRPQQARTWWTSLGERGEIATADPLGSLRSRDDEQRSLPNRGPEAAPGRPESKDTPTPDRSPGPRPPTKGEADARPAEEHRTPRPEDEDARQQTAAQRQQAIKAFKDSPDVRSLSYFPRRQELSIDDVRPLNLDLCAFDAGHLLDPDCEIATCLDTKLARLWVDREDAGDTLAWVLKDQYYDRESGDWPDPRRTCRLVVRQGRLHLEWLDKDIKPADPLCAALDNSVLAVSCQGLQPDGQPDVTAPRISRRIVFAEPVELPAGQRAITIEPLKNGSRSLEVLDRRLRGMDPKSIRCRFEVSHPTLALPLLIERVHEDRKTDEQMNKKIMMLPPAPVRCGYDDVNAGKKPPELTRKEGGLQIEVAIWFSMTNRASLVSESKVVGLEDVPLLQSVFSREFLGDVSADPSGAPKALKIAVLEKFESLVNDRTAKGKQYLAAGFNRFISSGDQKEKANGLGIVKIDQWEFLQRRIAAIERNKMQIRGPGKYNDPIPSGGLHTVEVTQKQYEDAVKPYVDEQQRHEKLRAGAIDDMRRRLDSDADEISEALGGPKSSAVFKPIVVQIVGLKAVARTHGPDHGGQDSREYEIEIIKPLPP